jgi:hypothetical protein
MSQKLQNSSRNIESHLIILTNAIGTLRGRPDSQIVPRQAINSRLLRWYIEVHGKGLKWAKERHAFLSSLINWVTYQIQKDTGISMYSTTMQKTSG